MIPLLLWIIATMDSAFAGYREAAGRNALIDKRRYYRRAMLKGAIAGQAAVAITGILILAEVARSSDAAALIRDLQNAGLHMLYVYVPYAAVVVAAFLIRIFPSVDLRSITSTVIFGPFTLIRPLVAIAGVVWGAMVASQKTTVAFCVLVLLLMLSLSDVLRWWARHTDSS